MTFSKKSILVAGTVANKVPKVRITDTKIYVLVLTLSNQDNIKQLKQLKPGFKKASNWNKFY